MGNSRNVSEGVEGGKQSGGYGLRIALGAADLTREPRLGSRNGERVVKDARGIHEGVAMHDAIAEELRVLEARDETEDALLLGPGEVRLEANEVVRRALGILGPELDHRPGSAPRPWVRKANGLHGAIAGGVHAGAGNLLHGLTRAEQVLLLELAGNDPVGSQ